MGKNVCLKDVCVKMITVVIDISGITGNTFGKLPTAAAAFDSNTAFLRKYHFLVIVKNCNMSRPFPVDSSVGVVCRPPPPIGMGGRITVVKIIFQKV
ncbi:MAG: hypothetical protein OSJ72_07410 [Lachnospiraceae bacterium]|nr:hypothetical protein [Lachnospiraceae bacterium]